MDVAFDMASLEVELGRGVIENKHSTDVKHPSSPPRVCMNIHCEGKACSDLGRVLVLNDPRIRRPADCARGERADRHEPSGSDGLDEGRVFVIVFGVWLLL